MTKRFKRLIIHAGMHRTGNVSLQTAFARLNSEKLAVLDMVSTNHSLPCRLLFDDVPAGPLAPAETDSRSPEAKELTRHVRERLQHQLDTAEQEELILTADWLSSPAVDLAERLRTLSNLRDYFCDYCDTIEVYAYVRPPAPFCASMYQHRLRTRNVAFRVPWARYRDRFEPLFLVFGRANVHLRTFDRSALQAGDVVADFYNWANLPEALETTSLRRASLTAAGVSLAACFARNIAKDDNRNWAALRDGFFKRLGELEGPGFRFASDLTNPLIRKQRSDLSWIEEKMGGAIRGVEREPSVAHVLIGGEDEIMRAAAYFAPLLSNEEPLDPPDDPWAADASAWMRIQSYLSATPLAA